MITNYPIYVRLYRYLVELTISIEIKKILIIMNIYLSKKSSMIVKAHMDIVG